MPNPETFTKLTGTEMQKQVTIIIPKGPTTPKPEAVAIFEGNGQTPQTIIAKPMQFSTEFLVRFCIEFCLFSQPPDPRFDCYS